MHIEELSFKSLTEFSVGQYQFLESYNPGTLVPMYEYSIFYKLLTVGFRPFLGEIYTFWGFISGLENAILLVLSIGWIPLLFHFSGDRKLFFPILAIYAGIALFLFSIAQSVNVLGIMIRLKSSVIPFMAIFGWYGWFFVFQKRKESRII
ncbi:MAG TPA: hypothetical protein VLA71_19765 [Algoriphagus sp.]|nr:hypothetical protein [Algoriphagus sp.]